MVSYLVSVLYTIYLKLRFGRRIILKGLVKPEGFIKIYLEKDSKLVIDGNISLRSFAQIIVRSGAFCSIGKGCFFNRGCSVVCREKIIIGSETLFGEYVKVYDNDHKIINSIPNKSNFETEPIIIGGNSWIANDVNILKGSEIPNNTVVGAMSLVNKKHELSGIYIGIPAKLFKSFESM